MMTYTVHSQFLPQINYEGEATRGRNAFLTAPSPNGGKIMNSYLGGFEAVWEIDLWGRVRRGFESARADAQASLAAFHNILLTLHSDVAQNYFALRALDAQRGERDGLCQLHYRQSTWPR